MQSYQSQINLSICLERQFKAWSKALKKSFQKYIGANANQIHIFKNTKITLFILSLNHLDI